MLASDKVSVVIPVYNSERFLCESIESALSQTYPDIEIICVNDGSTDKSLEILEQFSDKITVISQKNSGLASALNAGIDAMTGKWFKWFSPDDVMYPFTVETLEKTAKNLDDDTIIYSNWNIIDETGIKLRSFSESDYNQLDVFDFNVRLLDGQQINVNTTLIPSSLAKDLKMNTKIDPVLVDYDFFLRAGLLQETNFYLITKPLIDFRVHKSQLSHQNITSSLKNLVIVGKNVLSKLPEEKRNQYNKNLGEFKKLKPISKKSMELGLKLISKFLPTNTTDKILVFYLNKIRQAR